MENKEYEKQLSIKEVRIGNIVYGSWDDQDDDDEDVVRYSVCKITGVDENGELGEGWSYMLENMESPVTDYYGGLYGVELTEEWLLKFGFEKKKVHVSGVEYDGWLNFSFHLDINHIENTFFYHWIGGNIEIKFVHQLQNLYFALTGSELTIKEDK